MFGLSSRIGRPALGLLEKSVGGGASSSSGPRIGADCLKRSFMALTPPEGGEAGSSCEGSSPVLSELTPLWPVFVVCTEPHFFPAYPLCQPLPPLVCEATG